MRRVRSGKSFRALLPRILPLRGAGIAFMNVLNYGDKDADIILLQPVDAHDLESMDREADLIRELSGRAFRLLAFCVPNWNRDLSPWKAPAVFGKEDFGDGAAKTLAQISDVCTDKTQTYFVGGYSLAGLFALWAVYQTDLFRGAAAASPSLWFPGFSDYMRAQKPMCSHIYLSLGDREEHTRSSVMASVGAKIREASALLEEQQIDHILEWNPGNHFKDNDLRTAKAFAWLIQRECRTI